MRWFTIVRTLFLVVALVLAALGATPAWASDDGGSYAIPRGPVEGVAQGCRSHESLYDPGKTEEGFTADATDGCNKVHWTSNTTDSPGSGTVTFKTIGNVDPWQAGYALPGPAGGSDSYCRYRAAHEANLWFTNYFKVPVGTQVTVKYACS